MKLYKVVCSFGILLAASTCFAQRYTITDLGTLGGGYSTAYGINTSGQVTGCSGGTVFLYSNGIMKGLGGRQETCGLGINASGQVAGYGAVYTNGNRTIHAFMFSEGSARDLGTLGGPSSLAYGINAFGSVIGTSDTIDPSVQHAFRYHDGLMIDMDPPMTLPVLRLPSMTPDRSRVGYSLRNIVISLFCIPPAK